MKANTIWAIIALSFIAYVTYSLGANRGRTEAKANPELHSQGYAFMDYDGRQFLIVDLGPIRD